MIFPQENIKTNTSRYHETHSTHQLMIITEYLFQ